ncbi:hypothetical protein OIE63_39945 (plasmid) [Streptomyces sp. NBC_01795]|uniref:hypothetical protein n=1 Tax=unclassified Streptomyces TaxID=2593676 RepID=UPI002DD9FAE0|nr:MULTISPECIES: hypothetical protein [unclassified Streptomyces]WSA97679.1 hypothetical protein OIE63_39945 [Streptomyces sp. NBC_01795]WSB82070.1 hypothetical protein OHB04_40865 [Streptomyces sp. NBC_01775]WSS18043.1 hypothetical protein OG533_39950 [Streptomyces sp. NBC_01186]
MADDNRTGAGIPAGIDYLEHLRAERQLLRRLWEHPQLVNNAIRRGLKSDHFLDDGNRYHFEALSHAHRSVSGNDKWGDNRRAAAKEWLKLRDQAFDVDIERPPSAGTVASATAVIRRNALERREYAGSSPDARAAAPVNRTGSEARVLEQLVRYPELVADATFWDLSSEHFSIPHDAAILQALMATHPGTAPEIIDDSWRRRRKGQVEDWLRREAPTVPAGAVEDLLSDARKHRRGEPEQPARGLPQDDLGGVLGGYDERTATGLSAGSPTSLDRERELLRQLWDAPELVLDAERSGIGFEHFTDAKHAALYRALLQTHDPETPAPEDPSAYARWRSGRRVDTYVMLDKHRLWVNDAGESLDPVPMVLKDGAPPTGPLVAVPIGLQDQVSEAVERLGATAKSEARTPLDAAGDTVDGAISGPGKPSYQPFQIAPTAEERRPVLVVVAGAKGSGAEPIANMAKAQLAGKDGDGKFVILGDKPLEPGQHLEAAKKAIREKSNTILLTDGRDPEALAQDMQSFARDYRIVFAAAATQDPLLDLNNLEAKLDPRSEKQETLTTRPKLAECASRAVGLGAETYVFEADENGRVVNAPAPPGERTPGQRIEEACKKELSEEMSLRSLAKAARLATMTKKPADHVEIMRVTADILRASPDKTADSLGGVVGAAIALHPRRVPFNLAKGFDLSAFTPSSQSKDSPWHVDGRVRPDKSLKLIGSKDLETMLLHRLRVFRKAAEEVEDFQSKLNERLRKGPGETPEEKREYERHKHTLRYLQRESKDRLRLHGEGVQSVLAQYRRRARLSPDQYLVLERKAREHKARTAVTGIGYGTKRPQTAQHLKQPHRRPVAVGSKR